MFTSWQLIERYLFIFASAIVHIESIVSDWETTSNASQFIHLENLIGSIHRYAPDYVRIYVRDTGLTKNQRLLLERYENVKIVGLNDIIEKKTERINAENELVHIDGKYLVQRSNDQFLYVDFIRKQFHLAIVIPFIVSQLFNVILQLNYSQIYTPCKQPSNSVDLIFYYNNEQNSSVDKLIREMNYVHHCYRQIRYLSVNLTASENEYPLGSFLMWRKLFLDEENRSYSLRTYGYTHFFLMEPDTRPIRQYWLDVIIHQITNGALEKFYFSTNWWVSGSIYRGTKFIGQRYVHINGNALYHLTTPFIAHIETFSKTYSLQQHAGTGYDLLMFILLMGNQTIGSRVWHKFQFSDFIQNCWHTGCDGTDLFNNTQFILNNPNTYLIHGTDRHEISIKYTFFKKYGLVLLAVLFGLLILRLCRLAKLKRIAVLICSWTRILH